MRDHLFLPFFGFLPTILSSNLDFFLHVKGGLTVNIPFQLTNSKIQGRNKGFDKKGGGNKYFPTKYCGVYSGEGERRSFLRSTISNLTFMTCWVLDRFSIGIESLRGCPFSLNDPGKI